MSLITETYLEGLDAFSDDVGKQFLACAAWLLLKINKLVVIFYLKDVISRLMRDYDMLMMGDNNAANHGIGGQGAQPPQPPSLAQAVAALIADRNEQTELLRQLVES